ERADLIGGKSLVVRARSPSDAAVIAEYLPEALVQLGSELLITGSGRDEFQRRQREPLGRLRREPVALRRFPARRRGIGRFAEGVVSVDLRELEVLIHDREEQRGLASEVRADGTFREAGLTGDPLETRRV